MVDLNKRQILAAEHAGDRLLVLAGPGTGKTSALIGRYLDNVLPKSIENNDES